jgi:uncharacterized protein
MADTGGSFLSSAGHPRPAALLRTRYNVGVIELDVLLAVVDERATRRSSYHHGDLHWQAVAHAGLQLLPEVPGCDGEVLFLFALFHDSQRWNEDDDPGHGGRGAALARELHDHGSGGFELGEERLRLLCAACEGHTDGGSSEDPTIGACWDADRLNLWRVGTPPAPRFLSTHAARDPRLIADAAAWHGAEYGWPALAAAYGLA